MNLQRNYELDLAMQEHGEEIKVKVHRYGGSIG
jgi:hypothetical protein